MKNSIYRNGELDAVRFVAMLVIGSVWFMGVYPFVVQLFSMSFFFKIFNYPALLFDVLFVVVGLVLMRNRTDWIMLISFLVISAISTLYFNHLSVMMWLNGMRTYKGLLFIMPIMRYLTATPGRTTYFIHLFDKSLFWFLAIQWPCMLYQFLRYGAGDYGGGSLGNLCSGVISMLIYTISFYLMVKRWDHSKSYFRNLLDNWLLLFMLLPSFLNETKVSFVFVVMYFFLLVPMDRKFLMRMVWVVPMVLIFMVGGAMIYANSVGGKGSEIFNRDYLEAYTFGDDIILDLIEIYVEDEQNDLITKDYARGAKFLAVSLVLDDKPWSLWWGFGLGQFKGSSMMERTDFAKRFQFLVDGTPMMGMIWILDLGLIGIAWVLLWLFVYIRPLRRLGSRRNLRLQCFLVLLYLVVLLYGPNFDYIVFCLIYVYMLYFSSRWDDVEAEQRLEAEERREALEQARRRDAIKQG